MNNFFALPVFFALVCAPMSSGAWWGPYGAAPYWGGYAPPYYYAPPYPVYAHPAPPPWTRSYAYPQFPVGESFDSYAPPPPVWEPPAGPFDDEMTAPGATSDKSPKDHKEALKESEDRRAAFRARVDAHRAAVKARRDAWRQYLDKYYPEPPVTMGTSAQPQLQATPVEPQSVERKPEPLPDVLPNATVKPKTE